MESVDRPVFEEDSCVPIPIQKFVESGAEVRDPKLPAQRPGSAAGDTKRADAGGLCLNSIALATEKSGVAPSARICSKPSCCASTPLATHHFMVVLITIFGLVTGGIVGGVIGSMLGNHEAGMLWGAILFGFWCFFVVATVSAIFSLLLEIARNSRDTVRLLSAMNSKF